ncbi:MAG: hypothetical protein C0622_01255 [Desulfuromonas sp.]|nr:MAG: hypothetical protein C0622_01255 [Desulfuromonas sp.]
MRIILLFISLFLLTSVATAGQVNGFIYHRFGDDRYPSTNISADIFEQQLAYLRDNGIEVISLREIAERLSAGQDLPEHAVALSVDDAFRSFADVAMPLIRKYDIPITLFVNTDAVGTAGNLDWNELSELQTEGVTLGNHTETHAYLVESRPGETYAQWQQRIRAEIDRSQAAFQEHLGVTPELFAYPYGEYSDEVVAIIRGAGFKAAFAQQSGVMHDKHDPLTLPRFPMGGPYATLTGFIDKLRMRPLIVTVQEPTNPVVAVNPP